ncbi:MAG TPA: methyltransferase domain-containing protein [Sulfuricella sp.]|nr:methyltransferase domain-containing protein [Sulfuricella sp.]
MTIFRCGYLLVNEQNPIESAFALHAAGALADAEIAYRRILAADPQHIEAQHYLGVLLHQRGYTQEGISLILCALESDAGSASRYNDLGNILVQTGDLANAATAFCSSLDLNGNDANVWNNLGSVLHRQQNFVDAENAYRNALRNDADFAPALNNLAALLAETGRDEESSLFSCRAYILPPLAGKPLKMLGIAYYRLGRIADAADCYRAWLRAEPDNAIGRHFLAACTGKDVPTRATDGFVTATFDNMAESFDEKLIGKLSYRGPEIIADLLDGYVAADGTLDVLDGGCGTGLCAPVLVPYARHLTGVDLSPGMLAKARERKLYDELVAVELTAYLLNRKNAFDLIAMADTLIYFGDLAALFAAVRQALRPGGTFTFTVETTAETAQRVDYHLGPSGRYDHSRCYITQELDAAGFALLRSDDVVLRNELGKPAQGIGVLTRTLEH